MKSARSLRAALAAGVCLLPLSALAQSSDDTSFDVGEKPPSAVATLPPNNWITIGSQYQSGPGTYLGRYSGAVNPGFYGLGDFHFAGRDPWDSGGTRYWEFTGDNLGLDSRSVSAKIGEQGSWALGFSYEGVPYYATDSFQSVYTTTGALVPGLAPGSRSATMRQILPAVGNPYQSTVPPGARFPLFMPQATNSPGNLMYDYKLGLQRDIFTGTGKYQWNDWTITGTIRHEHKSGIQANSLVIGGAPAVTSAGSKTGSNAAVTPGMTGGLAYFAMPIDYDTDRYDVTAAYSDERLQAQLGYVFSNFTDNNVVFNAQNPFKFFAASNASLSFGAGSAANVTAPFVQAPSNSAHQVKVMLGYNFTPTTRLNANFAYGLQMQNDAYVTGTGNANFNPTLPRSSFDGLIQTIYGNIALTAQPLPRLDVRLSYTMDDRDNQSPRNAYNVYQRSDSSNGTFLNLPSSYQHQIVTAEAGYRILPQTKFTLNETFDSTYRTYANVSQVTANTVTAKLRSALTEDLYGALSVSHQDRVAHNYNLNQWWSLLNPAGGDYEPSGFMMYFEASRQHDDVKGVLDYAPTNTVSASLMVKFSKDTYPDGSYGLRNNHNLAIGPDVSWQVTPAVSAHAFYNYQQLYYEQNSIYESSTTAAINTSASGSGYSVPWNNKTTDSVHSFGVTLDWQAIKDVLKFSFDYNFAYGNTSYALGEGVVMYGGTITSPTFLPSITMQALPDVTSMLNSVSLRGEYTFLPNMTLIFGYAFERFTYKDFMVGTSSTQYANAYLPGTLSPNESIHVVGAALRLRF